MGPRTVSTRHLTTSFVVAAGTTEAAPASLPVPLGETFLEYVSVMVPPGHAGLTGLAVEYDGTRILPWGGSGDWFRADGETLTLPVDFLVSHPVMLKGFNGDVYGHTFYFRFQVNDLRALLPQSKSVTVQPVSST